MDNCSHLLQGGGLGLLLKEEAGGLDVVTRSGGLRLKQSLEGSSLSVVWHGDRTGQRIGGE
jgi:hypothetical protein